MMEIHLNNILKSKIAINNKFTFYYSLNLTPILLILL